MESFSRSRSKAVLQNLNLPKSCRVTITIANDDNSTITGVVHSVDQTAGKITLKNVSTGGSKLYGPQIYYCKDILDMQVLSDMPDESDCLFDSSKTKNVKNINRSKKMQPAHLSRLRSVDDDGLVLSNILRDELGDQGIGSEDDEYEDFYVTDKYTLICRVCEKFYDAIEYIMQQEAVGVVVDGQKLGRDGILSLVQISTDCELIIFDILRLGDKAFKSGLQAVFEADDVMKVIHDCRWISDYLRYQHNISMANIFDTQVANAFVYRSINEGDWPRFVETLPGCLISYLDLPVQDVQFTQVRERCKDKDEAVWLVRPLPEKLLEAATKNTKYLLRLHQVLLVEMLAEYRAGVGIYLNHVSGTVEDVEKCRVNSHLLPVAFTYIHKYTTDRPCSFERKDPQCSNKKGFRENIVKVPSNDVVFSHDSPWHKPHHSFGRGLPFSRKTNTPNTSKISGVPAEEKSKSRKGRNVQQQKSPCKINKNMTDQNESVTSQAKINKNMTEQNESVTSQAKINKNMTEQNESVTSQAKINKNMTEQNESVTSQAKINKNMTEQNESVTSQAKVEIENLSKNLEASTNCTHDASDVSSHIGKDVAVENNHYDEKKSPTAVDFSDTRAHNGTVSEPVSKQDWVVPASRPGVGQIENSLLWKLWGQNKTQSQIIASKSHTVLLEEQAPETIVAQRNQEAATAAPVTASVKEVVAPVTPSVKEVVAPGAPSVKEVSDDDDEEDKEAKELKRQMALLDQLHFVPANVASVSRTPTVQQKHSSGQQTDSSSSSRSSECQGMPQLIKVPELSPSQASSDSDGSRHVFKPSAANLKREENFTLSALMPAGMLETKQRSKKKGQSSRFGKEPVTLSDPPPRANTGEDFDFSLIPTPQSLTQRKEHALGVSSIGMGNPFSEDEGFCTPSNLLKSRFVSPQNGKEDSISDVELDMLLKSDKSQKILKLASQKPSTKILPFPAKAKSKKCDHS